MTGKSDKARKQRATKQPTSARLFAYEVCNLVRLRDGFARELFAAQAKDRGLAPEEEAFARVLVLGTVSHVGTLDELINGVLRTPKDIDDEVRDCLRISAYELFFLEKSAHVAVDQGVSLVSCVRPKAKGVANFCLRRLAEKVNTFPFGDVMTDNVALARSYGFPLWMCEMLVATYGREGAVDFMAAGDEPAPVFFTVNAGKADDAAVEEALHEAHIGFAVVDAEIGCYRLRLNSSVTDPAFLALINQGKVIVSDASAQRIAAAALPEVAPASMLEVGAGRGTKTLLLQSQAQRKYGRQIPLTSLDYLDFKTELLSARLADYGITQVTPVVGDGTKLDEVFGSRSFDAIFIDAPCSGLGTLRRHPELRWRITPEDVQSLAQVGEGMLTSAANHVNPGGLLTYATCTVTPEENTGVVQAFMTSPAFARFTAVSPAGTQAEAFAPRLTSASPDAHFAVQFTCIPQ